MNLCAGDVGRQELADRFFVPKEDGLQGRVLVVAFGASFPRGFDAPLVVAVENAPPPSNAKFSIFTDSRQGIFKRSA